MIDVDSKSRPLHFTPIMWIALVIVGLIGLHRLVVAPNQVRTLSYLEGDNPLIIPSTGQSHQFPVLGLEVQLPLGWTYLSVADDALASTPTFRHSVSQTIIRLQPFFWRAWPPSDVELEVETYGGFQIEWVELDHRRVGRLRHGEIDVMILVMTHQPHARLNAEARELFGRFRLTP